jgi:tetratricopeptide (TPR) repeat protein
MQVDTKVIFEQAHKLLTESKFVDSEYLFNTLLNNDRESAILLFYLATIFMKTKRQALAINLFKQSLQKQPDSAPAWCNLGYVYREELMLDEAREAFLKAIELKQDEPDFYANLGATYVAGGTPDKAIDILDKALALNTDHSVARWNVSLAYLEKGEWQKGWAAYEAGARIMDRQERTYQPENMPKWDGTPGQTVVVYGEQGIGDEIMFASMLPDLMAQCNVIIDGHPRLADIFRQSFPGVPVYGTRKDKELHWPQFHKIDAKIAIGSLGQFYRNNTTDYPGIPYLKANPLLVTKYKEKLASLGDKPKIGISWRGGIKATNLSHRFIDLNKWLPILTGIDADFISLQYNDDAKAQLDKFHADNPDIRYIHHWQDAMDDYDETAALVSNLDLIISVPQSVVHLAGALGVPTWQLTPKKAMWQMGAYGHDMPWYRCVKNYWQDDTHTWEPVIQQIKEELCSLYQMSIAA